MTLDDAEQSSGGKWKPGRLSAYERGDRAITATTLSELADFYHVPVHALIPGNSYRYVSRDSTPTIDIDMRAIARLPAQEVGPLAPYAATLTSSRAAEASEIFCIGPKALRLLATIYGVTPADLVAKFVEWHVVVASEDPIRSQKRTRTVILE